MDRLAKELFRSLRRASLSFSCGLYCSNSTVNTVATINTASTAAVMRTNSIRRL